jgi:DivIVA domain-containing protein
MTLSLDDVRNKRFRMARKSGYEVLEVDEFVDDVEETFAQLFEENQNLKRQVESLKSAPPAPAAATPPAPAPVQQARPAPAPAPAAASTEPQPIVVTTGKDASSAVVRLVEMSTEQAERLVSEATEDANRIREEANRIAHQVTTDARTRAERVESEARVNAERMQADAVSRVDKMDRDIESRRGEMFGDLQRQREELGKTVAALRTFESNYRRNLTNHLREQIKTIESVRAEPSDAPDAVRNAGPADQGNTNPGNSNRNGAASREPADRDETPTLGGGDQTSETPRLDALLGEQR